jgi:hypothetical protein
LQEWNDNDIRIEFPVSAYHAQKEFRWGLSDENVGSYRRGSSKHREEDIDEGKDG